MSRDFSIAMHHEIAEPREKCLEINERYNVAGIINSDSISIPYQTKRVMTRISIITPKYTQYIVEIWSSSQAMEPKFSKNFKKLQFVFIKGLTFHGLSDLKPGRPTFIFRLAQKDAIQSRFIWLSADRSDFWDSPLITQDFVPLKAVKDVN